MFGGLDIKGGGDKKKENATAPPAAATATAAAAAPSAFSFLQSSMEASTTPAAAALSSSGFSFLNATDKETATSTTPAAPTAAAAASSSAFGFLSTSEATLAAENGSSGFNFMETTTKKTVDHAAAAAAPAVTAASSFDFMSGGGLGHGGGVDTASSIMSRESPALSESGLSVSSSSNFASTTANLMSSHTSAAIPPTPPSFSASPGAPAAPAAVGAGVVFGGAVAQAGNKTIIKKRNRTSRIGVGAAHHANTAAAAAAPPPPAPVASPPISRPSASPPTTSQPASAPSTTSPPAGGDIAAAALEAQQRAEQFMQNKLVQEQSESRMHSSSPGLATIPSTDSDDIIAAAKAAAEEAQHISHKQQQHQQRSWGGGLTGLFRPRGSGTGITNLQSSGSSNTNNHSAHGGGGGSHSSNASASSGHNNNDNNKTNTRPPVPSSITSRAASTGSTFDERPNETPVERLQREQEQVKRAMAERQMQMMHATHPSAITASSSLSTEPLAIPSYGESKPIAVIPVPGPPSALNSRSVSLPMVAATFGRSSALTSTANTRIVAPPAAPKPVTTPTDLFHAMMKEFRAKVVMSMDEVKRLRKHRSVLLQERFGTTAKERLAAQQKSQAEAQQMAAAEAEDFELADRMGSLIESHARECAEYKTILENIGRALVQLDSQKKSLVNDVTKCFSEIQGKLKAFQEQEESKESQDNTEALKRFSAVSKQLSAENERLQQDLKHLERDAEAVAVERKELENAISEQGGVFEKLRDEARKRLTTVEEEIEELRKQLAAKVKVAAELRTEAAGHDESVLKVRVKFSRQLNRVQKKEMTIQDNREEWEFEKKTFEAQKEVHDKEVAEHSEALLTRDQLLDSLKREIELADTFESIVSKEIGFEVSPQYDDANKETDEELAQLQAEVAKSEAAVSESKEILKSVVAAIAALEEEKKATELRIPQLEEEKKAAAARRDFKAAGKASKEVKDSTTRLKEIEQELDGHVLERKEAAEAELIQLEQDLKGKRQVANEKEKEAGIAAMHRLSDNIKRLLATKESVCAKGETSIQSVGSYVLDGQIEALRLEGQTYGDKYGGWAELMAEIGLDHTVQEEQKEEEETIDKSNADEPEIVEQSPSASTIPATTTNNGDVTKEDTVKVDPEVKKQAMARFSALMGEIGKINVAIEAAAETEDFEKAAELDEELQRLLSAVENLGLTDDEMAVALAAKDEPTTATPEPAAVIVAVSSEEDPPISIAASSSADDQPVPTADDVAPEAESPPNSSTEGQETTATAAQQDATDDHAEPKVESTKNDGETVEEKRTTVDDDDDERTMEKESEEGIALHDSADGEQGEMKPMNGDLDGANNGETVEEIKTMTDKDVHQPLLENGAPKDSDDAANLTDDDL